ncbi:MAG: glycoside hydrolase family 13 protein [Planctomycetales bacterium]|nr:glycoside hydrolase family 13 protein [Planctomycetales bacterium]
MIDPRTNLISRALAWGLLSVVAAGGCEQAGIPSAALDPTTAGQAAERTPADPAVPVDNQFTSVAWSDAEPLPNVPAWAADAVFYQIFPERFSNGDPANDPTHGSLEFPELVPETWAISPWTGDWYARADWEAAAGPSYFDNGVFNRRYGGDLQGVIDQLDYLQTLGVNALYFNPLFYARSLHKYDAASMHHIEPYFGPDPAGDLELIASETSDPATWQWTAADKLFLELLAAAHERGMRVIIDGVFNHTGRDFFAFANLRDQQQDSPYRDWYIVQHFDDPATPHNEFRYKGWWGVDTLPEFADAEGGSDLHPGPKAYILDVTRRWMDPNGDGDPADGIDGWRLDVANEVPPKFWQDWHAVVRGINPAAYTVAEVWDDARDFLTSCGFSATMNYYAFSFPVKGYLIDGRLTPHDFGRELQLRRSEYPPAQQFALQNLMDSHDTDRLASMIVNRPQDEPYKRADRFDFDEAVTPRYHDDYAVRAPNAEERALQRLVVLMQMTYVGPPMVYYGDEAGMWGGDDPCDRKPMVWPDLTYDDEASDPLGRERSADPVAFDRELFDFYQAAIQARRELPVLRHGSFEVAEVDDKAKFFSFFRHGEGQHALVALNRGDQPYAWTLPAAPGASWRLVVGTSPDAVQMPDGAQTVTIAPRSGVLLISDSETLTATP